MSQHALTIRDHLTDQYPDVYTPEVLSVLSSLASFNQRVKTAMAARMQRRAYRQKTKPALLSWTPTA